MAGDAGRDTKLFPVCAPGQTDIETGTGPAPPTTLSRVASPPYAHTRGYAPVGSPVGWAVLLLTSTSRAPRPRRAPRTSTARSLAVRDVLGAWVKGSGWGGRRGGRSGRGGTEASPSPGPAAVRAPTKPHALSAFRVRMTARACPDRSNRPSAWWLCFIETVWIRWIER